MSRRIFYQGDEDGLACEHESDCENTATYRIEDTETGEFWEFCAEHKDQLKAEGWAE